MLCLSLSLRRAQRGPCVSPACPCGPLCSRSSIASSISLLRERAVTVVCWRCRLLDSETQELFGVDYFCENGVWLTQSLADSMSALGPSVLENVRPLVLFRRP